MSVPTSIRFADDLHQALRRKATADGRRVSDLVQQYAREGLRMERHPGVCFQTGPAGRRAKLMGGPDVVEVVSPYLDLDGERHARVARTAVDIGISEWAVQVAMRYYADHPDEIDAQIHAYRRALEEGYAAHLRARQLTG